MVSDRQNIMMHHFHLFSHTFSGRTDPTRRPHPANLQRQRATTFLSTPRQLICLLRAEGGLHRRQLKAGNTCARTLTQQEAQRD